MNYTRLAAVVILAAVAAASLPADAAQNDLQLYRLSYFDKNANRFRPDQESFNSLTNELGLAFAPKFLAPAATLGEAGFEVGFETSLTTINSSELYWKNVTEGGTPPSMLTTGQLHFRKGLPQSFEVGTTLTYLFLSQMFSAGAEVKWAINEGFYYVPDIAFRGAVNRTFATRDLDLTTAGFDAAMSKGFGLFGTTQLTPYAGYSMALVWASSRVINATPGETRDDGPNTYGLPVDQFVFNQNISANHRVFGGLRFKAAVAVIGYEFMLAFQSGIQTHSFKLAVDF
jgi:hypothetical protein